MEIPDSSPNREPKEEALTGLRERLQEQALFVFSEAMQQDEQEPEIYIVRHPLEVPDREEVLGIMFTEDGRRPFMYEYDKEYVMLFYPLSILDPEQNNNDTPDPIAVWIRERQRRTDEQGSNVWYEEHSYVLNELGFQPHAKDIEDLQEDISMIHGRSEASEIRRMREKIRRFKLTPLQEPPRDHFSEQ